MTLSEFDVMMAEVAAIEVEASDLHGIAVRLETYCYRMAGLDEIAREPGFAQWTIEGLAGFFDNPRQALQAKSSLSQAKETA